MSLLTIVKKSLREDPLSLLFILITSLGFTAAIVEFVLLQNFRFQLPVAACGLAFVIVGGYLRMTARMQLKKKAGFASLVSTARLQIVDGQKLVRDGVYKHIRHPLYLGEILRNLGVVLIFSSGIGTLFILIGAILLNSRANAEEQMLLEAFGSDYEEYRKKTKRLIPHIY